MVVPRIPDQKAELPMVVQVQLHFKFCAGFRFVPPEIVFIHKQLTSFSLGNTIGLIVIFLTLQLPKGGTIGIDWWGNTVMSNSMSTLCLFDTLVLTIYLVVS